MPLTLVAEGNGCRLYCGDCAEYEGGADLVLTNPYGPLPAKVIGKPMILSHDVGDKRDMEAIAMSPLAEVGRWNTTAAYGQEQGVWVGNLEPRPVELATLAPEMFEKRLGWWPLDLPLRLLEAYGYDWRENGRNTAQDWVPSSVVIDPFMGRGTTGRACQLLGLNFIGIDIDPERVELAKRYLGVA